MVITRNMVATEALLQKTHGSTVVRAGAVPGIQSADFKFDVSECKSGFGRWLAEHVWTTRRDDDLSTLFVTLRQTEMDISLAGVMEAMRKISVRNADDLERVSKLFTNWHQEQRGYAGAYAGEVFRPRSVVFEWPVLGSRAAEHIESPAAYFDLCAARIRALKPLKVRTWEGKEPPESLGVTARRATP